MKKVCTKCKVEKKVSDFAFRNKAKGKYASNCKSCQKIIKDKHYQNNKKQYMMRSKLRRAKFIEDWKLFKSTLSCTECGEDHPATLDFHHPGHKDISVAELTHGEVGWKKLMVEVKKCVVLCSNCHRILHYSGRSSNG